MIVTKAQNSCPQSLSHEVLASGGLTKAREKASLLREDKAKFHVLEPVSPHHLDQLLQVRQCLAYYVDRGVFHSVE